MMRLLCAHRTASVVAGTLFGALVLHVLFTGTAWLWNYFSFVPPFAFALVPLIVLGVVFWKRAWVAGVLSVAALLLGWTQTDFVLPRDMPPSGGRAPLHIFTWNTRFWNEESNPTFYPFLRGQNADVYQLSEYWDRSGNGLALDAELAREFPEHLAFTSGELVTLVRRELPATVVREHPSFLRVDLARDGETIRLYNVHIPMQLGRDMAGIFGARAEAFTELEADLTSSDTPGFVAGDFNSTTAMGVMQPLLRAYTDAATAGTAVFPATWAPSAAPWLRLWRIDYALHDQRLAVQSYERVDSIGNSDHLGLTVTLQ